MTSRTSFEKLRRKSDLPDLISGLNAVICIICVGRETKYEARLKGWATALYSYVCRAGSETGTRMRACKDYFAQCRLNALRGTFDNWGVTPRVPFRAGSSVIERRTILHQVSRTSRSLREADTEVVSDSLKSHWDLSTQTFETPDFLLDSFRTYVRTHFGGECRGHIGSVGPSSSFLRKKADGGVMGELKDITDNFRNEMFSLPQVLGLAASARDIIPSEFKIVNTDAVRCRLDGKYRVSGLAPRNLEAGVVFFPYDRSYEMSLDDWEVQREHLFALLACWYNTNLSELPRCRQVAVKERGWKVRVATPLEAPFRYLLGGVNSALLDTLEKSPQVVSALHGRPAEKLDWSHGRRTNLVFSADLKSATDHFPQDLMLVAADELSKHWPHAWAQLFMRAVGPHVMTSADGESEQVTSRGILMGSPVSWPLLSIYSAWLHELSGSDGWFAVCGDDYIGCHTYATYRQYRKYRSLTGAIGSPGKDVLGNQGVGVFAEELVTVGRCRWVPTVSVRAVLADPKSGKPSWSQGPEVSEALSVLSWNASDAGRVCASLHKEAYRFLRLKRIEPVGPRWAACAGFPGVPTHNTLLRARRMCSQSTDIVVAWITDLEMVWNASVLCEQLSEEVKGDILIKSIEYRHNVPSAEKGMWGPLRDVISSRLGSLSFAFFLAGIATIQTRASISRVSRVVQRVSSEIECRGRWLPADSRVDRAEGIWHRIQEMEPKCRPIPFRNFSLSYTFGVRSSESPLRRPKRRTGPGSPEWGARKRSRLL